MPGPYRGPVTEQDRFIRDQFVDASASIGSWHTMELFSAVVGTGQTITGATVSVKDSSSQTIWVDITGANATGIVFTLRGGLSGVFFTTLRANTGSGGSPGTYIWKNQAAGVVTGMATDTTGFTRMDDMFLQVANPASVTGGASVTVRARVFTSPEF